MGRDLLDVDGSLNQDGVISYTELNGVSVPEDTKEQPLICDEMSEIFLRLAEAGKDKTYSREAIQPALLDFS